MSYLIGDVEMQGSEPIDSHDVIRVAFTPKVVDGGKARFVARRRFRLDECVRDLSVPADTAPSEYCAPAWDPA